MSRESTGDERKQQRRIAYHPQTWLVQKCATGPIAGSLTSVAIGQIALGGGRLYPVLSATPNPGVAGDVFNLNVGFLSRAKSMVIARLD